MKTSDRREPQGTQRIAGVFVEFHDADGHCVAQSLFTPWTSATIPHVGDQLRCLAQDTASGRRRLLTGRVRARHFDVQQADDGACLWVRLEVEVVRRGGTRRPRRGPVDFSAN